MNQTDLENAAQFALDEVNNGGQETDPNLLEALTRIEEANLFYSLIKTDVFTNSASETIQRSVNNKIKEFAKKELNRLLGMSRGEEGSSAGSGFSKEESLALKVLAATMLKKDPSKIGIELKKPTMNTVSATPITNVGTASANGVQSTKSIVTKGNLDHEPTEEERKAAREAILAKARAAKGAKAKAGGAAGYSMPAGYTPPPQNTVVQSSSGSKTPGGLDVSKLVDGLVGPNQVATLSDNISMGGDPNVRL